MGALQALLTTTLASFSGKWQVDVGLTQQVDANSFSQQLLEEAAEDEPE
jgi:hypothetical protein